MRLSSLPLFRFCLWCYGALHGFVGGGIVLFNSFGNSASAGVCGEFSFSFSCLSFSFLLLWPFGIAMPFV